MGKLIVSEFVTLDGVMEDPGGAESFEPRRLGLPLRARRRGRRSSSSTRRSAPRRMLLGRVTYEGFAAAWPERSDPVGFADKMNGMPKYVVSTTLTEARLEQLDAPQGDVLESVAKLKTEIAGDILVAGSGRLAQTLLQHGPRRRAAADGLPARARRRQAVLRRGWRVRAPPGRGEAGGRRRRRDADLRACLKVREDGEHAAMRVRVLAQAELEEDLRRCAPRPFASVTNSRAAIARFERPSATSPSTSRSRSVSSSSGSDAAATAHEPRDDRRVDHGLAVA